MVKYLFRSQDHVTHKCLRAVYLADMEKPKNYYVLKETEPPSKKPLYIAIAVAVVLCFVGLILIVVGGVLTSKARKECPTEVSPSSKAPMVKPSTCEYSDEAKRVGLDKFLLKVKTTYYKMNPNNAVYDPDSTPTTIREDFSPYDAHPEAIRKRTDAARALYEEAQALDEKADSAKMKPREIKAIAQVKHYLQSNFGAPYDENYYAGDWMLGPNKFCWQPICGVGGDLRAHFTYKEWGVRPKTKKDLTFVVEHLKKLNDSLMQYIENVKYGVKAGFVRSVEDCQDGLYSIKRAYLKVSQQGPRGKVLYFLVISNLERYCWMLNLSLWGSV